QSRQSLQWVNSKLSLNVILRNEDDILYSGSCRIIRQSLNNRGSFVLEPLNNQRQRFMPREYRTLRQRISPSPSIIFRHPFTGRTITLKADDLSSSGFSVEENEDSSVLLVGMIVPELEIDFADSFKIKCKAQVLYRNAFKDRMGKDCVKCGFVILVMVISDHTKLSTVLQQARDERSYLCNRVDVDSLWSFLFETGFIYPEKYASILSNKDKFKENFEKLYLQDSDIARHFVYQEKGQILGHMSMLLFYANSWLIHHHAARKSGHLGAGIEVLKETGYYVNEFHSKYPDQMNYVICYFRTENKFPNRIFGGFEKYAKDPKVCSIDQFAYLLHQKCHMKKNLPDSWTLTEPEPEDFFELKSFYEHEAGGLMLDALDLEPGTRSYDLDNEYLRLGLKRKRHLFSLKKKGSIKAVFMVNVSDIGLNLSDLTNCIQALVIDSDDLPKELFFLCLSLLYRYYEQEEIPVMLYPVRYAAGRSIPYDKVYNLWVLSNQHSDSYLKYTENIFSRTRQPKEPIILAEQV
ncbi:MAG: PilZ protein, partial [Candidatus Brocadiaceae bacterium]|nr:PilZ protein [Candidatus Brocadiaceae bacterium]